MVEWSVNWYVLCSNVYILRQHNECVVQQLQIIHVNVPIAYNIAVMMFYGQLIMNFSSWRSDIENACQNKFQLCLTIIFETLRMLLWSFNFA